MMFKAIPQISMEQQQSEQQVVDLEKCQDRRRKENGMKTNLLCP